MDYIESADVKIPVLMKDPMAFSIHDTMEVETEAFIRVELPCGEAHGMG